MNVSRETTFNVLYRIEGISDERLDQIYYTYNIDFAIGVLVKYIESGGAIERKNKPKLLNRFLTFDIETTTIHAKTLWNDRENAVGFTYLQQVYLGNDKVLFLRDIDSLKKFFDCLSEKILEMCATLVIYVHNLSFEYQFLKNIIPVYDVFALKSRRIAKVYAYDGNIEFRCSYLLSNMSLQKFCENYCISRYQKDKEIIDYEILRYPWSELDDRILYYSAMDVIALYHAIENIMEKESDNIKSIPITNTGYVRRSCRTACLGTNYRRTNSRNARESYKQAADYRKNFLKQKLTYEQYMMFEQAFRGGDTHANRFHAGKILRNVGSYDFASSYPAVIVCSNEFPTGKFMDCTNDLNTEDDINYYTEKYFVVMTCVFQDLELKKPYETPVPYIPVAKTIHEKTSDCDIYDNGRIIYQHGYVECTFLGIEWQIIKKQYKGKMKVKKAFYTQKGYLPIELRKICFEWYKQKTELKGIEGKEYEYMKSKNRVNSVFGMMVEKIVKEIVEYSNGELKSRKPTLEESKKQLEDYYTPMQHKFLEYQWGVSITAIARVRLHDMINFVGDDFVYCDTDSVKLLYPEKYDKIFEDYNSRWIDFADNCGLEYKATNKKGKVCVLGIADKEKTYDKFVTLGAKKYAHVIDEKLGITIAGVPKELGSELLGSIENFKPGFIFAVPDSESNERRQMWKKKLTYNDSDDYYVSINDNRLHITSNIGIERTTYELGITEEYGYLIGYDYEQDDVWQ